VARVLDKTLDEHGAIAEGGLGLGSGALKGVMQFLAGVYHTHAAATSTKRGLQDDWEPKLFRGQDDIDELVPAGVSREVQRQNLIAEQFRLVDGRNWSISARHHLGVSQKVVNTSACPREKRRTWWLYLHSGGDRHLTSEHLVAHGANHFRCRSDESDVVFQACL
jgi:hypothetical protein